MKKKRNRYSGKEKKLPKGHKTIAFLGGKKRAQSQLEPFFEKILWVVLFIVLMVAVIGLYKFLSNM